MRQFMSLIFVSGFLAACADVTVPGNNPPPSAGQVALDGAWQLTALNGRAESSGITLELGADNNASGRAPCNRYFGTYTAGSDFSFSLPRVGATRRACPALNLEREYFNALSAATEYRPGREGDTFWAISAASINGVLTPNPGPPSAGITFTAATREFVANLGCNTASGPFTQNGDQLDFGAIAVTARQCFVAAPLEGPLLAAFPLVQRAAPTPFGIVDILRVAGRLGHFFQFGHERINFFSRLNRI